MERARLSIDAAKARYIADQQALLAGVISRGWDVRVAYQKFDGGKEGFSVIARKGNRWARTVAPTLAEGMAMLVGQINVIEHERERELA